MRTSLPSLLVLVLACGGTATEQPVVATEASNPPSATSPAAPSDPGAPPLPPAAPTPAPPSPIGPVTAECNVIAQKGAPVSPTTSNLPAPAPTGGIVASGTYVLTAVVVHTSPSPVPPPQSRPITMTVGIAGNVFQSVTEQQKTVFRHNGTYTYDATTSTTTFDCEHPTPITPSQPQKMEYTATPTSLTYFHQQTKNVTTVMTFTKL